MKTIVPAILAICLCLSGTSFQLQSQTLATPGIPLPPQFTAEGPNAADAPFAQRPYAPAQGSLHDHLKAQVAAARAQPKDAADPAQPDRMFRPVTAAQPPAKELSSLHFRGAGSRLDSSYVYYDYYGYDLPYERIYLTYNDDGQKVAEEHHFLPGMEYQDHLLQFSYNSDGRLTYGLEQRWNGTDWYSAYQKDFFYDEAGRLNKITGDIWFENTGWIEIEKVNYIYHTGFPQADSVLYFTNFTSEYILRDLEIFALDAHGLPMLRRLQYYDFLSGQMMEYQRELFTYDASANLHEAFTQRLCGNLPGSWYESNKKAFQYNPDGTLAEVLSYYASNNYEPSWILSGREVYGYDEEGNLEDEKLQYLTMTGEKAWNTAYYDSLVYQPGGLLAKSYHLNLDPAAGEFFVNGRADFTYNDQQLLLAESYSQKYCFDDLQPSYQYTKTYNEDQQIVEDAFHVWDEEDGEWAEAEWRTLFGYNGSGQLVEEHFQQRPTGSNDWMDANRMLHSYNGQGQLTESLMQYWHPGLNAWQDSRRILYAYAEPGGLTNQLTQYWDFSLLQWNDITNIQYTFDDQGLLQSEVHFYKQPEGDWEVLFQIAYTYNGQGQKTAELASKWDAEGQAWEEISRYMTGYDVKGRPIWNETSFYQGTVPTWADQNFILHFWEPAATGVAPATSSSLDCRLANPYHPGSPIACGNSLEGTAGQLALYDMLGRLQVQQPFTGTATLDGSLSPGCYWLLIQNERGESFRRKIIVQ